MAGAEQVSRSLLNSMIQSIVGPVRVWLMEHPTLAWWVVHPLWSLLAVVVAIALLIGLFGAIGRLTESIWLTLFQAVFQLVRWGAIASVMLLKVSLRFVRHIGQWVRSRSAVIPSVTSDAPALSTLTSSLQPAIDQPALQRAIATTSLDSASLNARLTSSDNRSQTRLLTLVTRLALLHQEETVLLAEIKQLLTTELDGN